MKRVLACSVFLLLFLWACDDSSNSAAPKLFTAEVESISSSLEDFSSSSKIPESSSAIEYSSQTDLVSSDARSNNETVSSNSAGEKSSSSVVRTISSSGVEFVSSSSNVIGSSTASETKYYSNVLFIGDNLLFGKYMHAVELNRGAVIFYRKDSILVETNLNPTTEDYHGEGSSGPDKDYYGFIKEAYNEENQEYTFYRASFVNNSWEVAPYDSEVVMHWFDEYIRQQISDKTEAIVFQVESMYNGYRGGTYGDTLSMIFVIDTIRSIAPQAKIIWVGQWEAEHYQLYKTYVDQYVPISHLRDVLTGTVWEGCLNTPDEYPYNLTCRMVCDQPSCADIYLNVVAHKPNDVGYKLIAYEILQALAKPK